jgi:hypothetical protein
MEIKIQDIVKERDSALVTIEKLRFELDMSNESKASALSDLEKQIKKNSDMMRSAENLRTANSDQKVKSHILLFNFPILNIVNNT